MCAVMKFLQSPKVVVPRTHDTSNVSELNEGVVRSPAQESQGVVYDIVVVDTITFQVFFIQVSKQKYADHSKPLKRMLCIKLLEVCELLEVA